MTPDARTVVVCFPADVGDRNLIHDPTFVDQLAGVVRAGRELCFVVLWAQGAGRKDWYLANDEAQLTTILQRIRPVGPWGFSDRIEVFATEELPYRTVDDDGWLHARALEVIETAGEVVLACRRADAPELHDVEGADAHSPGVVEEWFHEPHEGERLVGAHPFRHEDGAPGTWVAWNPNEDGEVRPGAY